MFSLEKKLLAPVVGDRQASGDLDRHVAYSERVDKLTIIVAAKGEYRHQYVSARLEVYPTQGGPFASFFAFKNFTKHILAHEEVDLIISQDILSFYAYLIAKRFRKPYFVTVHGAWWDQGKSFRSWWRKRAFFLITFALKRADGVRVVSQKLRDQLVDWGIDPRRLYVVPPPIDFQQVTAPKRTALSKLQRMYKEHDVLLYDGRLVQEKNLLFLLEVARRVFQARPAAKLVMIGRGELLNTLKAQSERMGIWGTAVEIVEGIIDQIPEYYAVAKVLVGPAISESFGKAAVKASFMELPVVAIRNLGSMTTVVDKKTGYLVDPGDTQEFVKKVLYLLEHEDKRITMGKRGKEFVTKEFDYYKNLLAIPEAWEAALRAFNKNRK